MAMLEVEKSVGKEEVESQGKVTEIRKAKESEFADKTPSKSLEPSPIPRKSISLDHLPDHTSQTLSLPPIPEYSKTLQVPVKPSADYVPYTLQDYHMLLVPSLSGAVLGASTIGSEEWTKRKQFENRRKAYARITFQRNCNQIAISTGRKPCKPALPCSTRLRGLEFAKRLHLPEIKHDWSDAERQELRALAAEMKSRLLA